MFRMGPFRYLLTVVALLSMVLTIGGQFSPDIIEDCEQYNNTICLSVNEPYILNYSLPQSNLCFPKKLRESMCQGMVIGQVNAAIGMIDWHLYEMKSRKKANESHEYCIAIVPADSETREKMIFYCPKSKTFTIDGESIDMPPNALVFYPVKIQKASNITTHYVYSFKSHNLVTYKMIQETALTVNLVTDAVEILMTEKNGDPRNYLKSGFREILFPNAILPDPNVTTTITPSTPVDSMTTSQSPKATTSIRSRKGWIIGLSVLSVLVFLLAISLCFLLKNRKKRKQISTTVPDLKATNEPSFSTIKTVDSYIEPRRTRKKQ